MAVSNQTRIGAPVKATGGLFSGELDAPLPTDATTPLDVTKLVSLGLIGEDGIKDTENRKSEDEKAWGGQIARTYQSEYGVEIKFTMLERRTSVLKEVRGQDNVIETTSEGGTLRVVKTTGDALPQRVYVADMRDGKTPLRKVYPIGQITDVGDVDYSHNSVIKYEVTATVYPDDDGVYCYEYELIPA